MDEELRARIRLEQTLRTAVANDRFVLHYQPIYATTERRLTGFEALVRLLADDGTLIAPEVFIPVAEELRLIDRIGAWVLQKACRNAATWPEHLSVAVNMFPAQFAAEGAVDVVAGALVDAGLAPHRLELEITENVMMANNEAIMSQLRRLKAMGIPIVMDDFGTGYSSLSYLWRFPFDNIKIDRSFVLELDDATYAATVVKTIIALGRELHIKTTVEGIETAKQFAFLQEAGADHGQGYFLGRPMPAREIAAHILAGFQPAASRRTPPQEREANLRLVK